MSRVGAHAQGSAGSGDARQGFCWPPVSDMGAIWLWGLSTLLIDPNALWHCQLVCSSNLWPRGQSQGKPPPLAQGAASVPRPPVFTSSTLSQLQCRDPKVLGRGHFSSQTSPGASPGSALTLRQGALQLDQLGFIQEHSGEALNGMAFGAAVLGTRELNLAH